MLGNIHSIESFGTVDGPGIRLVIFLQGCPMRCLYCHNPDTWDYDNNFLMSVEDILKIYEQNKEFYKNGGITVSGGEPLVQIDFVTQLFKQAKLLNIHTVLDTSGILFSKNNQVQFDKLMQYTDLVMLDIKHINNEEHKKLTGFSNRSVLDFATYLSEKNIPIWIRHVVVPTITDDERYLKELGKFLANIKSLKALDVLPYHNMAISKYENLNIDYPLKNISSLTKEEAIKARNIIVNALKNP